jgi:hypothetical protein
MRALCAYELINCDVEEHVANSIKSALDDEIMWADDIKVVAERNWTFI